MNYNSGSISSWEQAYTTERTITSTPHQQESNIFTESQLEYKEHTNRPTRTTTRTSTQSSYKPTIRSTTRATLANFWTGTTVLQQQHTNQNHQQQNPIYSVQNQYSTQQNHQNCQPALCVETISYLKKISIKVYSIDGIKTFECP